MNLKFKNFQNTLLKNSEEVDSFIKKNLPRNEGLNKKLIQAIKSVSYTHLTLPTIALV